MNPSKRKMYAVLAGVGISLGAAGIASAASTLSSQPAAVSVIAATAATTVDTTPTDPAANADTTSATATDRGKDHTPAFTSSVTIPAAADGTEPTAAELQAVATVTADQATAAALANTPGTAGTVALKSVAGNVVWEVDVTATAGGSYDVIVDAGNSTVLDTHAEGGNGGGPRGGHGDPTPAFTSSVTIPAAADGTEPTAAELQAVATVTADQATAAALANTPGTAGTVALKSVAGNVVWEVDVTATAGGSYDVIVDAGNSTVLDSHAEGGPGVGGHKGGHHAGDAGAANDSATATTTG